MNTTLLQPYIFLATLYCGILTGLIHHIFSAACFFARGNARLRICLEILFVSLSAAIAVVLLYWATGLTLRAYYAFGMTLGFGVYRLGVGRTVDSLFHRG